MALATELWQPTPSSTIAHIKRMRINEEGIIDFIAGLSPWIAPLPSAVFVQQAATRHLNSGDTLAWIIAIVIETLGLTTTHTALAFHGWNKTHDEKDKAPFGLAVTLATIYILATLGLIGVLEAFPGLNSYAPLLFPVLAVVGAVNLAMRGHHNQRVKAENSINAEEKQRRYADEDAEKQLKMEERRLKMMAKYGTQNVTLGVTHVTPSTVDDSKCDTDVTKSYTEEQRLSIIKDRIASGQKQQPTAWAKELGCSRQQIYRDIEKVNRLIVKDAQP